jgi:insulysin
MWICLLLLLEGARSFVSHHRTNTSPSITLLGGSRLYANSESSLDEEFEENEPSPRRRNMFQATSAAASILQSVMTSGVDPAQAATESNDVYFGPATPFSSRRQYKTIQLNNGLRVLLVSDKQALRASAAMSIEGAGQFQEPRKIPGLAHLMEHMTLSSYPERDFEDWLEDKEGASNAFTAPGYVCFHFNCPPEVFGEALSRFASLFVQSRVERVCRNKAVLTREIRRVDLELDYTSEATQKFYLSKALLNPDHPFSRFNAGNLESLERATYRARIDVSQGLIDFFQNHYLPSKAVLVVVCPTDVIVMDRWTSFVCKNILSSKSPDSSQQERAPFPEAFSSRSKPTQIVLYRTKSELFSAESTERLSIEWPLKLDYSSIDDSPIITAPAVGFIVSQIVARRGPGSLYLFLLRRKWVPKGSQGLPRITFPVDVSGFQMMKLEILVTMEGFANRSTIVAAVYDSLKAVRRISQPEESFLLPKTLLNQYLTVARLHGYVLAPRPPDAVELAVDAQTFGLEQVANPSVWPLFPPADDVRSIQMLRQVVADTLKLMCDPTKGIVFITASNKAIQISGRSIIDESLPRYISSEQWLVEPTTGARYFREDRTKLPAYVDEWIAARLDEDELLPPALNPLIPTKLRRPRPVLERKFVDGNRRFYYLEAPQGTDTDGMYSRDSVWREFTTLSTDRQVRGTSVAGTWENRATSSMIGTDWMLWQSSALTAGVPSLPLPVSPPEPTCRCAFVVQLLSSRPARANVKQAADSQLWLRSFENRISDLVSGVIFHCWFVPGCNLHD